MNWTQMCCGESCQYAEVQANDGTWFQLWKHADGGIEARRYSADKMPLDAERTPVTAHALSDLGIAV